MEVYKFTVPRLATTLIVLLSLEIQTTFPPSMYWKYNPQNVVIQAIDTLCSHQINHIGIE